MKGEVYCHFYLRMKYLSDVLNSQYFHLLTHDRFANVSKTYSKPFIILKIVYDDS